MSPEKRLELERRADELRAALHHRPAAIRDDHDLVVVVDGEEPVVIAPEDQALTLTLLGGEDFARSVLGWGHEPGCVVLVIVIDGWVQCTRIGVTQLAPGGDA